MKPIAFSLLALSLTSAAAHAAELHVAVASNFAAPMQKMAIAFEQQTGHRLALSFGSTGKFYAQIVHGAPFEILLAADEATPARLENEGHAVPATRFTYAVGRLALWSRQAGYVDENGEVLKSGRFERIALADPRLAPYGAAAMQVMKTLGLAETLAGKLVQGESIGQAYQFVATRNVPLGFVAQSQVYAQGGLKEGSVWLVPETLHDPIRQDAVLLSRGKDSQAARQLLDFLKSDAAKAVMQSFGYS